MKNTNIKFAARLHELREEANVSMMELAKAIGVSDAAICKWENGKAEPKASYVVKLAEYFDCPVEYMLGLDREYVSSRRATVTVVGKGKSLKTKPIVDVTADEELVVNSYKKLTPALKDAIKDTLKALTATDAKRTVAANDDE